MRMRMGMRRRRRRRRMSPNIGQTCELLSSLLIFSSKQGTGSYPAACAAGLGEMTDWHTDRRGVSCSACCGVVWCVVCGALGRAELCRPSCLSSHSALAGRAPPSCLSLSQWRILVTDISDIAVRSRIQAKLNLQTGFCHHLAAGRESAFIVPATAQVICMTRATIGTKICQNSNIFLARDVCQLISSHKNRSLILLFLGIIFYIQLTPARPWNEKIHPTIYTWIVILTSVLTAYIYIRNTFLTYPLYCVLLYPIGHKLIIIKSLVKEAISLPYR